MRVEHVYRYPVKGLTAEALDSVELRPGAMLPWDRAFALAQGDAPFDPAEPRFLHKRNFLCLMAHAEAAAIRAAFDACTGRLMLAAPGQPAIAAHAFTADGQEQIALYLTRFLGHAARGTPRFHHVPGHHFADESEPYLSIVGEATLRDLEQHVGAPRERLRFRANLYISGAAPWAELGWIGQHLQIGGARVRIERRIPRCAATEVNPATAVRDAKPVRELRDLFGHTDLGVYGRVIDGGTVAPGSGVELLGP